MMFYRFFIKKRKSKIRSYLRGYKRLKEEDSLEIIAQIKNEMVNTPINGESLSSLIHQPEEICFHQFLVYRLLNFEFNKALLIAHNHPQKNFKYPLPKKWLDILKKQGYSTPLIQNKLLWIIFLYKWYCVGIATGILELFNSFASQSIPKKTYVYFDNLSKNNLPSTKQPVNQNNIINWYLDQEEANNIREITHNVENSSDFEFKNRTIKKLRGPLPYLSTWVERLKFVSWLTAYTISALFSARKKLIFRQKIFDQIVKIKRNFNPAKSYFFHNSGHILRPLWTYRVEKQGAEIILYFYSTNIYSFKIKGKKHLQDLYWEVISWPNYWVWDKMQKEFIQQFSIKKPAIKVKNVIPFSSIEHNQDLVFPKKFILIFDVQPMRSSIYASIGMADEIYSIENSLKFLTSIEEIASENNLSVVIKRKRESEKIDKKYLRKIRQLTKENNWLEIDSEMDALSILKKSTPLVVISMPFTSTALIASSLGLNSVYYDVTQSLNQLDYDEDEVTFISGKTELKKKIKARLGT